MPDILEAAGDLIRTVEKDDVADESTRPELGDLWIAVGRGEWDLFVAAWNRAHDFMDEMSERQDARQGDEFVRLHEQRMAAA